MKTYPNWLVPIEQSKKLKRIGFDVECAFFYDDILKEISFDEEDVGLINWNNKDFTKCVSLPTWEQALEWFRKKGLVGTIIYFKDTFLNKTLYCFEVKDEKGYLVSACKNIIEKYEESREKLLNSLIEIFIDRV